MFEQLVARIGSVESRLVVGIVHLNRLEIEDATEIERQPFTWLILLRHPEGAGILIGDVAGGKSVACGRRRHGLAIGEQHPAGEQLVAFLPGLCRQPMREITEARVDVHCAVRVEAGGMQSDATLEIPVDGDPRCSRIPPIPV